MKKTYRSSFMYIMIFSLLLLMTWQFVSKTTDSNKKSYSMNEFYKDVYDKKVTKVEVSVIQTVIGAGNAKVYLTNNDFYSFDIVSLDNFDLTLLQLSEEFGFKYYITSIPRPNLFWENFLPVVLVVVLGLIVFYMFLQINGGSSGSRVMNFGKNRAKMVSNDKRKVTFNDVAGLDEEKLELKEVVDFLKHPKKYIDIGARIPKGVLLVGPPGTGKTLLAKAVAGEAGVPFFSISGSDFVEMFVGVGASRVRDLFEQAKKNLPCIVFIDEIDAVGRKRGAGHGGGHDEREQTLNQLLVEMDGFGINEGIIIIAATNRPDILDPALLRAGRFDRQVVVGIPDVKGREEILNVHAKGKLMAEEVDLKIIALTTSGFTGADLENLLNEAALLTARENKKEIDMEEIRKAFVKLGIGTEKKNRAINKKERQVTAYHEAGHGILFELLPQLDPVHIISIIPTGRAGGYTLAVPEEDTMYLTKSKMEQRIVASLGGRVAEEIVMDDITTGASGDIEHATNIARNMITKYGMSKKLGPILFGKENEEVFIGRELNTRDYSEDIAVQIDKEIKTLIEECYEKAKKIITENIEVLHQTANLLIEKEKITGDDFRKLFPKGAIHKTINQDIGGFLNPVDLENGLE